MGASANGDGQAPRVQQPLAAEADLPPFERGGALLGELRIAGSDTLSNVLTRLAEGFTLLHPNVSILVEAHGSSSGPPALVAGSVELASMVREMTQRESTAFSEKFGYAPTGVRFAFEALEVFVHPSNPVDPLTMAQLDAMFSTTRKRGAPRDVATWGALRVAGEFGERRIDLIGRNPASGTYGWFKQRVLAKGDFKTTVREQPGSAAVRQAVANEPGAVGYGPATDLAPDIRRVAILAEDGRAVLPTPDEIRSGHYPIARPVWLHANRRPGEPLSPNVRAFLLFTLSREGRDVIERSGFTAHSRATAEPERAKVL